jgi:hypothetical protein
MTGVDGASPKCRGSALMSAWSNSRNRIPFEVRPTLPAVVIDLARGISTLQKGCHVIHQMTDVLSDVAGQGRHRSRDVRRRVE